MLSKPAPSELINSRCPAPEFTPYFEELNFWSPESPCYFSLVGLKRKSTHFTTRFPSYLISNNSASHQFPTSTTFYRENSQRMFSLQIESKPKPNIRVNLNMFPYLFIELLRFKAYISNLWLIVFKSAQYLNSLNKGWEKIETGELSLFYFK